VRVENALRVTVAKETERNDDDKNLADSDVAILSALSDTRGNSEEHGHDT